MNGEQKRGASGHLGVIAYRGEGAEGRKASVPRESSGPFQDRCDMAMAFPSAHPKEMAEEVVPRTHLVQFMQCHAYYPAACLHRAMP